MPLRGLCYTKTLKFRGFISPLHLANGKLIHTAWHYGTVLKTPWHNVHNGVQHTAQHSVQQCIVVYSCVK